MNERRRMHRGYLCPSRRTTGTELPMECHDYLQQNRRTVSLDQLKSNAKAQFGDEVARHIGAGRFVHG